MPINCLDFSHGSTAAVSFPKSLNLPGGLGTALKPAWEPVICARKALAGTVAVNVQAWGTGALNIDACRIGHANDADLTVSQSKNPGRTDTVSSGVYGSDRPQQSVNTAGRWPPNVILDPAAAAELDKQSGTTKGQIGMKKTEGGFRFMSEGAQRFQQGIPDEGGASRYFPVFKYTAKAPTAERPSADGVNHPTVKPLELIRWLVRLVTPPHGTVLDPFAGTGTTGEAAIHEHRHAILIEREPDYLPLIRARLHKPHAIGFDFDEEAQ